MENIINFNKDIKFDTMIYEIEKLNIDHDFEVNDFTINGNYILSGTYKDSEIKIGSESFNYKIPFTIELNNNVDLETVNLEINDFDYKINNNVLSITINNLLTYDEIETDLFKEMDEDYRDDFDELENTEKDFIEPEELNPVENQDNYVKYKIHILKENETIDDICTIYKVSKSTIINYNHDEIKPGSKIIIPNEE